jgi:hypothetical protein
MYCYSFLSEKVVHTFSSCMLYRFESPMEVTNFLLTRDPLGHIMLSAHTNST